MAVRFENDAAGRLFYETLSRMPATDGERQRHTKFAIPVILSVEDSVVMHDNSRFNRAVKMCDTDQDGLITHQEALIFAASL